jgi:hypothetical protein
MRSVVKSDAVDPHSYHTFALSPCPNFPREFHHAVTQVMPPDATVRPTPARTVATLICMMEAAHWGQFTESGLWRTLGVSQARDRDQASYAYRVCRRVMKCRVL